MDRASMIFCALSLAVSVGIAMLVYPFAAVSEQELAAARTPVDPEMLGEVDMGDFGSLSVQELMSYYLENPPAAPESGAGVRNVRMQGC